MRVQQTGRSQSLAWAIASAVLFCGACNKSAATVDTEETDSEHPTTEVTSGTETSSDSVAESETTDGDTTVAPDMDAPPEPACGEPAPACDGGQDVFGSCLGTEPIAGEYIRGFAFDVNLDGELDLMHAKLNGGLDVRAHAGGEYAPPEEMMGTAALGELENWLAADLNNDAVAELILSTETGEFIVEAGAMPILHDVVLRPSAEHTVASGDLNLDGHPDLATLTPQLCVAYGDSDLNFAAPICFDGPPGGTSDALVVADFDGDDVSEIVAVTGANVISLSGFVTTFRSTSEGPALIGSVDYLGATGMVVAELDGDPTPELAIVSQTDEIGGALLTVHSLVDDEWIPEQESCAAPFVRTVQAIDLDGDGIDELVSSPLGSLNKSLHAIVDGELQAVVLDGLFLPSIHQLDETAGEEMVTSTAIWRSLP